MGKGRVARAQGQDMGGASQIARKAYADQSALPAPKGKMSRQYNEPMADPRAGNRIARSSLGTGFVVYEEKEGGRRGGKGKRV